jgi:spermidine synthase
MFSVLRNVAAALVLATALAACAEAPPGERIVHTERSAFQTLVVSDSDDRRCLRFGDVGASLVQSCRLHADPVRLAFHYTKAMAAVLLAWQPQPRHVLLIGVGGGSLPTALAAVVPGMTIDGVDVDPAVLRVARRYFALQPGPRLRLHAADGAAFVAQARARGERYDAVLLDAFDDDGVPPALFGEAFLRDVHAILAPHGVLLANTVEVSLHAGEKAAAAAVFGTVWTLRPAAGTNNRLLIAAADPARLPAPAALFARLSGQRAALERLGIEEAWVRELEVARAPVAFQAGG